MHDRLSWQMRSPTNWERLRPAHVPPAVASPVQVKTVGATVVGARVVVVGARVAVVVGARVVVAAEMTASKHALLPLQTGVPVIVACRQLKSPEHAGSPTIVASKQA
jgi:hypothetical protein